jgi:polysaccharide export outer membrane protein
MQVIQSTLLAACGVMLAVTLARPAPVIGDGLGPGDSVQITVFQNPDLTTEARVSSAGTLVFPLIGEINVADRTPIEAGRVIAKLLRDGKFVRDPQVSVALVAIRSRQVSVLGQVGRPGPYSLEEPNPTVTDILALAGGVSPGGDDTVVVMTRRNGDVEKLEINLPAIYRNGDLSADVEIVSGDTIFVPTAPVFYVYGAVQRPGAYRLEPNTTVLRALSLGGGLTPRGTERGLKIHRRMPDGSLRELDARVADEVAPDDIIRIKESVF